MRCGLVDRSPSGWRSESRVKGTALVEVMVFIRRPMRPCSRRRWTLRMRRLPSSRSRLRCFPWRWRKIRSLSIMVSLASLLCGAHRQREGPLIRMVSALSAGCRGGAKILRTVVSQFVVMLMMVLVRAFLVVRRTARWMAVTAMSSAFRAIYSGLQPSLPL